MAMATQRRRAKTPELTSFSIRPPQADRADRSLYSAGEKAAPAASPIKKEREGAMPQQE
jgi:hypothetical protein